MLGLIALDDDRASEWRHSILRYQGWAFGEVERFRIAEALLDHCMTSQEKHEVLSAMITLESLGQSYVLQARRACMQHGGDWAQFVFRVFTITLALREWDGPVDDPAWESIRIEFLQGRKAISPVSFESRPLPKFEPIQQMAPRDAEWYCRLLVHDNWSSRDQVILQAEFMTLEAFGQALEHAKPRLMQQAFTIAQIIVPDLGTQPALDWIESELARAEMRGCRELAEAQRDRLRALLNRDGTAAPQER